jgi:hypothetical protein
MNIKGIFILTGAFLVSGCLPVDSKMSSENAATMTAASKAHMTIAEHIVDLHNTRRTLERVTQQRSLADTISCDISGFYTFEEQNSADFTVDFVDCVNAQGRVNGKLQGSLDTVGLTFTFTYSSAHFETEDTMKNVVIMKDLNAVTTVNISQMYYEFRHSGTYQFDTPRFKGVLIANTQETNRHSLSNPEVCSGEQLYTDEQGNELVVDRSENNQISLYYNDVHVRTYNCSWMPIE